MMNAIKALIAYLDKNLVSFEPGVVKIPSIFLKRLVRSEVIGTRAEGKDRPAGGQAFLRREMDNAASGPY
jgi:hypothetical protein